MAGSATKPNAGARGQYARSEDTRNRILDAALEEAGQVGFQNTSMAKIAARADVAIGILNYHFGSKREMLHELMASQVDDLLSRLTTPSESDSFFEYERAILTAYLGFLHANPHYVRLSEEIRLHDPELYRQGTGAHVSNIAARIARGIERGDLRNLTREEIRAQAYFMLGALTFLDRFIEDDDYPGDASVAASFIDSLRAGLAR